MPRKMVGVGHGSFDRTFPPEYPNEPGGLSQRAHQPFNELTPDGWTNAASTNYSLTTDARGNIGQTLFPEGHVAGNAPDRLSYSFGSTLSDLYIHFWFKLSANWYGHPGNTNKIIFISDDTNSDTLIIRAFGKADQQIKLNVASQGTDMSGQFGASAEQNGSALTNGVSSTGDDFVLTRDVWRRIEIRFVASSSGGVADGEIHGWIDGVKVMEYTGVRTVEAGATGFGAVQWEPTYGGGANDGSAALETTVAAGGTVLDFAGDGDTIGIEAYQPVSITLDDASVFKTNTTTWVDYFAGTINIADALPSQASAGNNVSWTNNVQADQWQYMDDLYLSGA